MKPKHHAWFSLMTIAAALGLCAAQGEASGYGAPPLRFEQNVGQADPEVAYVVRGARHRRWRSRAVTQQRRAQRSSDAQRCGRCAAARARRARGGT